MIKTGNPVGARKNLDDERLDVATVLVAAGGGHRQRGRMNLLFALLVVVYAQYLFIFDGQEKIYQSMPVFYSDVVNEFEGLIGKTDARGTGPLENRRLY